MNLNERMNKYVDNIHSFAHSKFIHYGSGFATLGTCKTHRASIYALIGEKLVQLCRTDF